ncbi:hypothetical protein OMP38_03720 [Cohnella ginsengisoli]|uniref:Spore germination protein N-terminal domain-containing protein n=1 Tax=Cohnella ginsengisoli TaxID=425004 RepID=A0A9X4KDK0_9BACL|nr:hypothetical protein [Cohnella ginsengisoli]MDG0790058.1 hypothetical protein [Cohnella ginsengisoli]
MKWAKACRIIAASMLLPLSAGCWDRLEINDLALVMATGIDEVEEGQVKLSVQIFVPKKSRRHPERRWRSSRRRRRLANDREGSDGHLGRGRGIALADDDVEKAHLGA